MDIEELEYCEEALSLLLEWLRNKDIYFSKESLLPLFSGEEGKFMQEENDNHLIGEMNAVRGVISGAKPFSGNSYMNEINSDRDIVKFYQNVIISTLIKEFPDELQRVINENGDVEFYNPSNEFSMFVKHMLANNEKLFTQMNEENNNTSYSPLTAQSILYGYGKYSTLYFQLEGEALSAAHRDYPEIEDDYDPILQAAARRGMKWLLEQDLSEWESQYNNTKKIILTKFEEWKRR